LRHQLNWASSALEMVNVLRDLCLPDKDRRARVNRVLARCHSVNCIYLEKYAEYWLGCS
jgi:hypothetical protein